MALKNTTFRLPDELRDEMDALAERMNIPSGELKRRIVHMGMDAIKAELDGTDVSANASPALAGLISQQKKLSEMVERQLAQAEKAVERQKAQADSVVARLTTQQQKLGEAIEERVTQAEKAFERQKGQVEHFLGNLVTQQKKLSEQVMGHLPGFLQRNRDAADQGGTETADETAAE